MSAKESLSTIEKKLNKKQKEYDNLIKDIADKKTKEKKLKDEIESLQSKYILELLKVNNIGIKDLKDLMSVDN